MRVERILDRLYCLSRLDRGDRAAWAAFFGSGDLLNRYEWHYGLVYGRRGLRAELLFTKELPEEDAWEYSAVRFLMGLVPLHIDRLRKCAYGGCRKWFFAANRDDQQFCSRGSCRQNHYDSDPKRRKSKKIYMRDYRAERKRHARNPKSGVGLGRAREETRRTKKSLR